MGDAIPPVEHRTVNEEQCVAALEVLNGHIQNHGGRVELADFDQVQQRLTVRLSGFCLTCPAWPATLHGFLKPYLQDELGLTHVEVADRRLSDSATARLERAFARRGEQA